MYLPSRPAIRPWLKDPPRRVEQKPQEPPNVEGNYLSTSYTSHNSSLTFIFLHSVLRTSGKASDDRCLAPLSEAPSYR